MQKKLNPKYRRLYKNTERATKQRAAPENSQILHSAQQPLCGTAETSQSSLLALLAVGRKETVHQQYHKTSNSSVVSRERLEQKAEM
jgi:hypothetical protein